MRTVRHYKITSECELLLPTGAIVLDVVTIYGHPHVIVELQDSHAEPAPRQFRCYHHEHRISPELDLRYIGTIKIREEWWSAFELTRLPPLPPDEDDEENEEA